MPNWEFTCDCIIAKLDYIFWYSQDKCSYEDKETNVRPTFVSQGSDSVYKARFEEWKSVVWARELDVPESYFVSVFMSGLREEIRVLVQVLDPQSVSHAWAIAGLQESYLKSFNKNSSSTSLQKSGQIGQKLNDEWAMKNGENAGPIEQEIMGGKVPKKVFPAMNSIPAEMDTKTVIQKDKKMSCPIETHLTFESLQNKPENGFACPSNSEPMCAFIEQKLEKKMVSQVGSLHSSCSTEMDVNKSIQELALVIEGAKRKQHHNGKDILEEIHSSKLGHHSMGNEDACVVDVGNVRDVHIGKLDQHTTKMVLGQWIRDILKGFTKLKFGVRNGFNQLGVAQATLVWLRGPDPGGTRLGPLSLPSQLHPWGQGCFEQRGICHDPAEKK